MLPHLVLCAADIDGRAADLAEQHVAVADQEVALRVAHRRRAVAAAAGLMEEHGAVLGDDLGEERERLGVAETLPVIVGPPLPSLRA